MAATVLSRSSSLYPGLEPSYAPAAHSSSPNPAPAQVVGEAILAAASAPAAGADSAAALTASAAQGVGEAVLASAAVAAAAAAAKTDTGVAGVEAATAVDNESATAPALPASTGAKSPLSKVKFQILIILISNPSWSGDTNITAVVSVCRSADITFAYVNPVAFE